MTEAGGLRVAALYDIHGNLPALEAVLDDVRQAGAETVVVGGDVFPGPMSADALSVLLDLDVPVRFVRGNGERELLELSAGRPTSVPKPYQEAMRWEAERLDAGLRRELESWPPTVTLEVRGLGEVLFCHATPRSDSEIFIEATPERALSPLFDRCGTSLVVCGHTHMQFDRSIGGVRVVNAGSVGMPFGEAGAYWLLLDSAVELRRTQYDLQEAARRVRQSGHPQAGAFALHNIEQPPTEHEMMEIFRRAELRPATS